ncbi:MAG: hypothetical protein L0I24_22215, partial [Pseudonocardia sp.]|nr:hypothetical protein [Pseudonocardia sp.]
FPPSLERLADDPDRRVAGIALQWAGHARENAGDPEGAVAAAERSLALVEDEDGPWAAAILHTQIAQLAMQLGRRAEAERHARAALPVLERLGATDDLLQMRSLMTLAAIADGRLEKAAEQIARADRVDESETFFFGRVVQDLGVAELALARGEPGAGLATYLASVDRMRCLVFPGLPVTGLEPWLLFAESAALTALAHYGGPEHLARGRDLYASCVAKMSGVLAADHAYLDYPVAGTVLFALAGWGLLREAGSADPAVRLLVLAEGFAYNRTVPTMAWERIVPAAEDLAPGRIAALRAEYGERRGPELLDEARAVVEKLGG